MGRRRVGEEPMVVMRRRVPARVIEVLATEAEKRGITGGELIDRLCERAGFYGEPKPSIDASLTGVIQPCDHEWQINTGLAFDQCLHCTEKRWHT